MLDGVSDDNLDDPQVEQKVGLKDGGLVELKGGSLDDLMADVLVDWSGVLMAATSVACSDSWWADVTGHAKADSSASRQVVEWAALMEIWWAVMMVVGWVAG